LIQLAAAIATKVAPFLYFADATRASVRGFAGSGLLQRLYGYRRGDAPYQKAKNSAQRTFSEDVDRLMGAARKKYRQFTVRQLCSDAGANPVMPVPDPSPNAGRRREW
jgi:hypothetical protein